MFGMAPEEAQGKLTTMKKNGEAWMVVLGGATHWQATR